MPNMSVEAIDALFFGLEKRKSYFDFLKKIRHGVKSLV